MQSRANHDSMRRPIRPPRQERGAVAVVIALSLVGLIGFMGLALDLGKLFVAKSELQNSADACALAAARELTGANEKQFKLAEAAGIATGERHNVLFQGEKIVVKKVEFSTTLDGNYAEADSADGNSRYARCEAERTGIANWFIQVLNLVPGISIGDQTVAASAVATLAPSQITSCAIPAALCGDKIKNEDGEDPSIGTWLESVLGPPKGGKDEEDGDLDGQFMWVDLEPGGGSQGGSAKLSGHLTGPGVCNLPSIGADVGEAGVKSSLAAAWNSRFGIYHGAVTEDQAAPDYSGYAYTYTETKKGNKTEIKTTWPDKKNAFPDFADKRANNAAYQGDNTTGLDTKGTIKNSSYLKQHGGDRRLATAAVVSCDNLLKVESWACVFMLHPINNSQGGGGTGDVRMYLEYLGRSNEPNSPCATNGVPAGPDAVGPLVPALVR